MKIATIHYYPHTVVEATNGQLGEGRPLCPQNLLAAANNILEKGADCHTIKLYRSGGVKDGWHHLNALKNLMGAGVIESQMIPMEIHD